MKLFKIKFSSKNGSATKVVKADNAIEAYQYVLDNYGPLSYNKDSVLEINEYDEPITTSYNFTPVSKVRGAVREEWRRYIDYLHEWAVDHKDFRYYGCTPASFDEWLDNDYIDEPSQLDIMDLIRGESDE